MSERRRFLSSESPMSIGRSPKGGCGMDEILKTRQEIGRLQAAHSALLRALMTSEPFIQGSVVRRFSVCGKAGCRCQRGEKHGPFWYLSRSEDGHTRMRYLGKEKAEATVARVRIFQRWRQLRRRLQKVEDALDEAWERLEEQLAAAGEGGAKVWRTASGTRIQIRPETHS